MVISHFIINSKPTKRTTVIIIHAKEIETKTNVFFKFLSQRQSKANTVINKRPLNDLVKLFEMKTYQQTIVLLIIYRKYISKTVLVWITSPVRMYY